MPHKETYNQLLSHVGHFPAGYIDFYIPNLGVVYNKERQKTYLLSFSCPLYLIGQDSPLYFQVGSPNPLGSYWGCQISYLVIQCFILVQKW